MQEIRAVDCISGLPLNELTAPANTPDSVVVSEFLSASGQIISMLESFFLSDIGYDEKSI